MGCACGSGTGASGKRTTYVVQFTDGTTKTYASEVEAQAAIARRGGGSYRMQ